MRQDLRGQVQHQLSTGIDLTRWVGSIGLAVAVGIAYFVAARIRENTPGGFLLPRHHQPSIVPNT